MKPSEWLQSEGWVRVHSEIESVASVWRDPITGKQYLFIQAIQIQDGRDSAIQPCGHPLSAIVTNGTTSYCSQCAADSLRANIAAGVEN